RRLAESNRAAGAVNWAAKVSTNFWIPSTFRSGSERPLFLRQLFYPDISKAYRAVIALQHDWAGFVHLIVQLAASRLVALDFIMNFDAIKKGGDAVANDCDLGGLPFAGG